MADHGFDQDKESRPQCGRCDTQVLARPQWAVTVHPCTGCGDAVVDWAELDSSVDAAAVSDPVRQSAAASPASAHSAIFGREARLSWVLAGLAGLIGAAAFTHSAGYFVTFMTGNSERAVLGLFRNEQWLSIAAALLLASFVGGVVTASLCRRHWWLAHPHGPTVLTALCLFVAAGVDIAVDGWSTNQVSFVPVLFAAFGIGALNTSFVKNGEVSIPLSYVTGTLVKMGQGIERHLSGASAREWLGYFLLWFSFIAGAATGGGISLVVSGSQMLAVAALVCTLTSGYTFFHVDRRALRN
ncbi:hypothetical protein LAUMK142_00790 [Mycobacterium pseudokansasii]|uniref:DUF1275 domain-containing protein n=1 Tax=Mycobacterium pseudokansasii TaxID=2341080 RepID=A0A498QKR5_9MYCO|nr:hypothetical protein LAUMK142_00790 [Mycobacterium pseudokansasii]